MDLPAGHTDDMNVTIHPDRTALQLTEAIMAIITNFDAGTEEVLAVERDFGLTRDDALLAFDRVQGGIVRALTARLINCPIREKDPLAYYSFHSAWQTLPSDENAPDKKLSGGPWLIWFQALRERMNRR